MNCLMKIKMEIHPRIYNRLIDPLLKSTRNRIISRVSENDRVLDIACGTGELVKELAAKCASVTGIDLDERMIEFAIKNNSGPLNNTKFIKSDAANLNKFNENSYSAVNFSLAIHQFYPDEQKVIINEARRLSNRIIITDYSYPLPGGIKKLLLHWIERMAGKDHYKNFREFLKKGGIPGIMGEAGMTCKHSEISGSGAFTLYIFEN